IALAGCIVLPLARSQTAPDEVAAVPESGLTDLDTREKSLSLQIDKLNLSMADLALENDLLEELGRRLPNVSDATLHQLFKDTDILNGPMWERSELKGKALSDKMLEHYEAKKESSRIRFEAMQKQLNVRRAQIADIHRELKRNEERLLAQDQRMQILRALRESRNPSAPADPFGPERSVPVEDVETLKDKLTYTANQLLVLSNRLGKQHPQVKHMKAELAEIQQRLADVSEDDVKARAKSAVPGSMLVKAVSGEIKDWQEIVQTATRDGAWDHVIKPLVGSIRKKISAQDPIMERFDRLNAVEAFLEQDRTAGVLGTEVLGLLSEIERQRETFVLRVVNRTAGDLMIRLDGIDQPLRIP
ncbi:MAG: hypothetical protein AAF492_31425, partial [Verrucomicrobiota bacterium]